MCERKRKEKCPEHSHHPSIGTEPPAVAPTRESCHNSTSSVPAAPVLVSPQTALQTSSVVTFARQLACSCPPPPPPPPSCSPSVHALCFSVSEGHSGAPQRSTAQHSTRMAQHLISLMQAQCCSSSCPPYQHIDPRHHIDVGIAPPLMGDKAAERLAHHHTPAQAQVLVQICPNALAELSKDLACGGRGLKGVLAGCLHHCHVLRGNVLRCKGGGGTREGQGRGGKGGDCEWQKRKGGV